MTGKSLRHLSHYIFLLILMAIGIALIILSGKNMSYQTGIVIFLSLAYFSWGMIHHILEKELHPEIITEYLLFSILGAGAILGVIYYL